ncbi:CDGSH iron-sulfur domain-containing protein [Haliangium ochraceum]|uniref:Iron sulphur domain-containing, CDGSH-type n=1 Tax=Haliangium ochraceum (strain DSM 14365 / JCM 11303 / SMP-2) TaxID=502025 RepID=D0LWN8_HALO1|nr:CDGSH iron-sulfur domain-containing protein [Haliangium ochraceum]ACY17688.1 Iron sulphur domain-containing, CDGSH-type [Haliangium ochraceum DSM 14365]
MADVTIQISKNGPLLIKEPVKVVDMNTGDELQIEKFPIALCRCGQSVNKPYCDGAHSKCSFDGTLA